jgi:acyl carrier protein
MPLPQAVIDFLNENAQNNGTGSPGRSDDLFQLGALDSFALVDFVTLLEQQCGVKIPDADVNPANFRNIETIERYVESRVSEPPAVAGG